MLTHGKTPVPYTVSWTAEEEHYVAPCAYFGGRPALSQPNSPGVGKPSFGKPHSQRQREAIAHCLCDLCGKSLKPHTKISLSHARPVPHGASGWAILQVEPMLHRACAALCIDWCPSLKRDVADGSLFVRQVTRWRAQAAIMSREYVREITGQDCTALGHAKVELLRWRDRDLTWLNRGKVDE